MKPTSIPVPDWTPDPAPEAVFSVPNARFSVLSPRLIRMEFSPENCFEDHPSQLIWNRRFSGQDLPEPAFSSSFQDNLLKIQTSDLSLEYRVTPQGFTSSSLSITLRHTGHTWRFGDTNNGILPGTIRTLDKITGKTILNPGRISTEGWTLLDDSYSLVFNQDGWIKLRSTPPGSLDLYFLGYGQDVAACLRDFNTAVGACPLIPRQILGNWWSRYHAYSSTELLKLMQQFREENIPLSVCVIDMDWHITNTGNDSTGWTGYTWNRDLFPDPEYTLRQLHDLGLLVSLNLHPAEGIHPHEEAYPAFARRMGIDPRTETPIPFDLANPEFAEAYFEILHHPQEEMGIDFWWLDWQQGEFSSLPGLDPLFWLNHLHFHDLGRDGIKRPMIFSRWGGDGSNRTPIGFSGDATVTWQSLAFQPYLTASSANAGYGWWSHDIGGHMGGVEDPELYLRWTQFGVFSPIFRFHSTKSHFHERLPWKFDAETARLSGEILRFRHRLVPYIYTMAWRNHRTGQSLIQPMYHHHPDRPEAYACPQQYSFGQDIIAAPFTAPADPETGLSRQVLWLPPSREDNPPTDGPAASEWYNLFTGEVLPDGWHAVYGTREDIPAYIRAGAVLPLAGELSLHQPGRIPVDLEIRLYAGAEGHFDLYEDDGATTAYQQGRYAITSISQHLEPDGFRCLVSPASGETSLVPETRSITIVWFGITQPDNVSVLRNGEEIEAEWEHCQATGSLRLSPITLAPTDSLDARIGYAQANRLFRPDNRLFQLFKLLKHFKLDSWIKEGIYRQAEDLFTDIRFLHSFFRTLPNSLTETQVSALVETFCRAGVHYSDLTDRDFLVLWNTDSLQEFQLQDRTWLSGCLSEDIPGELKTGTIPGFLQLPLYKAGEREHEYMIRFADLLRYVFRTDSG